MMATAFLGYTLPWGQMSFWAATVITNLFSAIPYVGRSASCTWLWGGFGVDNATLHRFFSLHYLLPFAIAGVVVLHIWALHVPGNNNPLGIDVKGPQDTLPFHPYYTVKDLFYLVLLPDLVCAASCSMRPISSSIRSMRAGQSDRDARGHRAGMVSLALLRHPEIDPEQADGRAGAVRGLC